MTKSKPLISVIIINYNYASYVGQAIESVLNQSYENIEIIIINDGSTDESDSIIKGYVDKNHGIRYINQENLGANVARNTGIDIAKGEYFFLLDSDNWLNQNHISEMYHIASTNKADVVYSDLQHFGDDGERLVTPEFDIDYLKITNFIDTSSLVRKKCLRGHRFDPWLNRRFLQDYDFFLGLALKGVKIMKCTATVLNYRIHKSQNGYKATDVEKIKKYKENYSYILQKYTDQYPKEFGPSIKYSNHLQINSLFEGVDLKYEVDTLNEKNDALEEEIIQLKSHLEEVKRKLQLISESKTWRTRNKISKMMGRDV